MQRYIGRHSIEEPEKVNIPKKQSGDNTVLLLKNIGYLCLENWMWFVISLVICVGIGYYYLKSTPPVFQRSVSILIKTEKSPEETIFGEMAVDNVPSNLANEMELMRTGTIAYEIAHRLQLQVEQSVKGKLHDIVLYGQDSPVKISFVDLPEDQTAFFELDLDSKGKLKLSNFRKNGSSLKEKVEGSLGDTLNTPVGKIFIESTIEGKIKPIDDLQVNHFNIASAAKRVESGIGTRLRKGTTIIDLTYNDVSPSRAEDILNTLVGVYNENWIKDRNLKTSNTDKFIKERLAFIEDELGDVEQSISQWKSENLMLDVNAAGSLAQSQATQAESEIQNLNYQLFMSKNIRDYLVDGKHEGQLLPSNSGITNSNIETLIGEYNNLMLKRNSHLANSSLQNPLVVDLDENLATLRGQILQSLDYELSMIQSKLGQVRGRMGSAVSKIASNPRKAQQLLSVERQQKVKEELYLFLLQRREENELSQAFGAYNNQFIEAPRGTNVPVSPIASKVMLYSVAIGLLLPALIIGGGEFLNTKVRGRKDIESLSAPYAGDIPQYAVEKKISRFNKTKKSEQEMPVVLVKEKNRNFINEAFRVIRTNLEFMLGFNKSHNVVMITSINPSSGKTFISANLSTAFAIRDKKVILVDLDLRKGSLSEYVNSPKSGVSNYLSGQESNYRNLIIKLGRVDVLPCGSLPPNPAELLFSERFRTMMEELKSQYDYVFLDCPPVEVVADASIISPYAELTLFVIRVNHMEKDMLQEVEQWYHDKKYGNLAVILNGIERTKSRYGYHKYGYHYGSYGYGYGKEK